MKNYLRLLRLVTGYKRYAVLNIGCNVLSVVFSLFSLTMVAPFLNVLFSQGQTYSEMPWSFSVKVLLNNFNFHLSMYVAENGKLQALSLISGLVVVMFLMKNLFRYLGMYFMAPIRTGVVRDLRNQLYGKVLVLPLSYFSNERKGDIMARMTNDVQEIEWSIMQSLEVIFREPLTVILFLTTMVLMSPQLSLFVFILLPVAGLLIGRIGKSLRRTSGKSQEQMGGLLSNIEETLGGLRIIRAFTAEAFSFDKFRENNNRFRKLQKRLYRKRDLSSPLSEFLGAVVLVIVMYFGGRLVLSTDASLDPSVFIAFIAIFSQLIPPAKAFTDAYSNVQRGLASAERINKILDAEVTIRDRAGAVSIGHFQDRIEYRDVSFAYHQGGSGWVLKHINLEVPRGKTIALVGQSGSGKTTLVDLLPRFYELEQGSITVDGQDIRSLTLDSLRGLMGIVNQESILFNDTVFNNIAFGMPDATLEDVTRAATIAHAHEFIAQLPEGYQTNIGDRGGKLSGGQRQRIAIARAILKNPPILILDEATSALDTQSEKLVQEAIYKLMENRTSLVIAHRLSTIRKADLIAVVEHGRLVQSGTHESLMATPGLYRNLVEMQTFGT